MTAEVLRTPDLYGTRTVLAWSLTSKPQLWKVRLFSLSLLSVQPHLYVPLLLQISDAHSFVCAVP